MTSHSRKQVLHVRSAAAIGPIAALFLATTGLATLVDAALAAEFTATVHSIDEVADGAMPRITGVTASEAVLEFQSNAPLACSVVYGQTPDFGLVAVDDDMDGGAHADHHPALAGLTPETQYFFRVQGVAADGTIYIGDVQSFTTAALEIGGAVDQAALAAGGRISAVSSNYGGAGDGDPWGASSAIDGSRSTAWSSSGDGDDAFIEVQLAAPTSVGEVAVWTRNMSDGTARILTFTLTTDQGAVLGPFTLPDSSQPYRFQIDQMANSLRLDVVKSTGGNVGLIEFNIFAR